MSDQKGIICFTFSLFWLCCAVSVNAQSIKYEYDAAGNRISRELNLVQMPQMPQERSSKTIPDTTGVEALLGSLKVVVYPNPTKGELSIKLGGLESSEKVDVLLFDSHGSLLYKQVSAMGISNINMSGLPPGWYILQATNKDTSLKFKIIKE